MNSEKPLALLLLPTRTYRATADAATATGLQHELEHTELHYNEQGTHLIEIDALLPLPKHAFVVAQIIAPRTFFTSVCTYHLRISSIFESSLDKPFP